MDECNRCGRRLNRHGACINLFCGGAPTLEELMHGYECQCGEERVSTVVYSRDGDGAVTMHTRRQCKFMGYGAVPADGPAPPSPRARVARTRPRCIWRGVDGGQSVVMLQVMGEMWGSWQRWGDAPDPTRS